MEKLNTVIDQYSNFVEMMPHETKTVESYKWVIMAIGTLTAAYSFFALNSTGLTLIIGLVVIAMWTIQALVLGNISEKNCAYYNDPETKLFASYFVPAELNEKSTQKSNFENEIFGFLNSKKIPVVSLGQGSDFKPTTSVINFKVEDSVREKFTNAALSASDIIVLDLLGLREDDQFNADGLSDAKVSIIRLPLDMSCKEKLISKWTDAGFELINTASVSDSQLAIVSGRQAQLFQDDVFELLDPLKELLRV